jgi:hypothetical protein
MSLAHMLEAVRGKVARVSEDGVEVQLSKPRRTFRADVLLGPWMSPPTEGDAVLVALPSEPEHHPVVLGVIAARLPTTVEPVAPPDAQETRIRNRKVVVEAGEELVLQCGAGIIRITRDGKIIVRGEHVLSRARGTNRIKGGSVAIN